MKNACPRAAPVGAWVSISFGDSPVNTLFVNKKPNKLLRLQTLQASVTHQSSWSWTGPVSSGGDWGQCCM